jgi:AraC-type DNA-binding domain-containing proteins
VYSAKEALDWLNRTKMDIVLTDIRMPGMTGLQMMDIILGQWPQCRIIFLTGFNEFDYVYSAIKHNGVKYLLKNEGHEAIIETVENVINEIEKSREINDLIAAVTRQQIDLAMPSLQKEYFMDMLSGVVIEMESREKHFSEMKIPLAASMPVLLMMGKVDNPHAEMSSLDRYKLVNAISAVVDKYLMHSVKSICLEYEWFNILWIIQPLSLEEGISSSFRPPENWGRLSLFLKGTLETIQEICKQSLNIPVSFMVDNESTEWEKVPFRFEALKKLLNYRFGARAEMQLNSSDIIAYSKDAGLVKCDEIEKARLLMKKLRIMETYLESGQKERFNTVLYEFTGYLKNINSKSYTPALEIYYSVSLVILSYINNWNLADKISPKVNLGILTSADDHKTWQDAASYLEKLSGVIFEAQQNEENERSLAAISKVQKYINEHLNEDLSLVRLGELVYFNPSYLSRLFKQITGENLLKYINEVRLNKSKVLLMDRNLKIHEIAARLGFISAPYFTRFFKKHLNISPQEFRDSILNK